MGTAVSRPEFKAVVEKLAKQYDLGMSQHLGEFEQSIFQIAIESKKDSLLAAINRLQPGTTNLMVVHIGIENPEMDALLDMDSPIMRNSENLSLVSKHRHAELKALCSEDFRKAVRTNRVVLVTYRDLISQVGRKSMKRPE